MTAQLDGSSPAWCVRLVSEFNAADQRAIAVARMLTPRELNWRPHPGAWSVGQCLDHLRITNEVYGRAIANSLDGRPRAVAQEITPGWFGAWFIRNVIEPSAEAKRRAPRKVKPVDVVDPSILDRFLDSNAKTRELVRRAADYDVNRIRFTNPFLPVIHFTVGTGLEILSRHERRHLLQAERVPDFLRLSRESAST